MQFEFIESLLELFLELFLVLYQLLHLKLSVLARLFVRKDHLTVALAKFVYRLAEVLHLIEGQLHVRFVLLQLDVDGLVFNDDFGLPHLHHVELLHYDLLLRRALHLQVAYLVCHPVKDVPVVI